MISKHSFVILLTATIDPGDYKDDLSRSDPRIRLADYQRSLSFWANLDDSRFAGVVFCENSGADVASLVDLISTTRLPVEFLSFRGNTKPQGLHYGYSELGIIDYALEYSHLIRASKYFIKVSGRLTYPSIVQLLDTLPGDFDAIVDHRHRYKREGGFGIKARTQLMFFSREFYCLHFLGVRGEMIAHYSHLEEYIAVKLAAAQSYRGIVKRFKRECQPFGVAGFNNRSYRTVRNQCKAKIRSVSRTLLPFVWI